MADFNFGSILSGLGGNLLGMFTGNSAGAGAGAGSGATSRIGDAASTGFDTDLSTTQYAGTLPDGTQGVSTDLIGMTNITAAQGTFDSPTQDTLYQDTSVTGGNAMTMVDPNVNPNVNTETGFFGKDGGLGFNQNTLETLMDVGKFGVALDNYKENRGRARRLEENNVILKNNAINDYNRSRKRSASLAAGLAGEKAEKLEPRKESELVKGI